MHDLFHANDGRKALEELQIISAESRISPYLLFVSECMRERFDSMVFKNPTERSAAQRTFINSMEPVIYDLECILNIIKKIEWMTTMCRSESLSSDDWEAYVQADVHAFHVECRSLFDAVAAAVCSVASKKKQIPETFYDLQKACRINRARLDSLIGADLAQLLVSTEWFISLRDRRDFIVHNRRDALVRLDRQTDKILFRTMFASQLDDYTGPPEFAFEEDWILFQPYAGYYLGRLLYFLDVFTEIVTKRLSVEYVATTPYEPPAYAGAMKCIHLAKFCLSPAA